MPRVLVKLVDGRQLDHLAEVHHPDPVADVLDDREVVGDEEVGQPELVWRSSSRLRTWLWIDVERGDRFVADDEVGVDREGSGDADALPLATGELVRVAVDMALVQPDLAEQLADQGLALRLVAEAVDQRALADDLADRHPRVEAGVRVLEDDLQVAPHDLIRADDAGTASSA